MKQKRSHGYKNIHSNGSIVVAQNKMLRESKFVTINGIQYMLPDEDNTPDSTYLDADIPIGIEIINPPTNDTKQGN